MSASAGWRRIEAGYRLLSAEVTDNGNGFGPSRGSGRWAVTVAGRWVANEDTLAEAKRTAVREMARPTTSVNCPPDCGCGEPCPWY